MNARIKLRRGSITLLDLLGAFLGVLAVLGVMTYLRYRSFERTKGEIRGPLPDSAQERAKSGDHLIKATSDTPPL